MRTQKNKISDGKLAAIIAGAFSVTAILAVVAAILVRMSAHQNNSSLLSSSKIESETVSSSIAQTEQNSSTEDVIYETDEGTSFNVPDELRAVYLKPGRDFLIKNTDSEKTIKSQIDSAIASTKKLGFNSIVIFTKTTYGVIFEDAELKSAASIDILKYAIETAKNNNIYSYVVYPVFAEQKENKVVEISDFSKQTVDKIIKRAEGFAKKYQPSAIVLDNYTITDSDSMKGFHEQNANGRDIADFLRSEVSDSVRKTRNAIRQNNKVSQIGLLTTGVWANATTDSKGSNTMSNYQSYVDGFADTRDFILNHKFNFVMVENTMPTDSVKNNFKTIAQWWTNLCNQADIPYFNVHASSKLSTALGEFASPDQLIRQVSILKELKTYCGSVFDSLPALLEDKEGSTTLLLKYFDNQIKDNLVFSKLSMSKPNANKITTYDDTITFAGATDPNFKTTFNDKVIDVTEKGYFSYDAALNIGTNIFKITHKGRTVTYTVLRKVKLLESVTPTGTLEVDGETNITISVKAFSGSSVTAKINGTTIKLTEIKPSDGSDEVPTSNYPSIEGVYKVPSATEKVQNLGTISITASWQGYSENMTGATIKVFARPKPIGETLSAIKITEKYAETFPTDRLNDQSQPFCYPLPAGTIDYVVGNELVYSDSSGTFKYYKLMSGHRVYSKDTVSLGKIEKKANKISAVTLSYDGRFANLKVDNSWSVPFKYIESPVSYQTVYEKIGKYDISGDYSVTTVTYRIFYTEEIDTSKITMDKNPLVSKIECVLKKVKVDDTEIPVCDIVLTLKTAGGFFGATPAYTNDNKTLDIRLNVSAPIQKADNAYGYTLNGSVIIVDAGHNKTSPGAAGSLKDATTGKYLYPEYIMNQMMREKVVPILKSLGAKVITIDNEKMPTAAQRLEYFKSVDPHIMLCIHHNAATSGSPRGAVGAYFNSYSQLLAKCIMNKIDKSGVNDASNRARDFYFDRLKMTREPYYPSMLIECGFISTAEEHEYLIKPEVQQKFAEAMVSGLIDYFVKTGSLNHEELKTETQSSSSSSSQGTESQIATSEIVAFIEPKKQLF